MKIIESGSWTLKRILEGEEKFLAINNYYGETIVCDIKENKTYGFPPLASEEDILSGKVLPDEEKTGVLRNPWDNKSLGYWESNTVLPSPSTNSVIFRTWDGRSCLYNRFLSEENGRWYVSLGQQGEFTKEEMTKIEAGINYSSFRL